MKKLLVGAVVSMLSILGSISVPSFGIDADSVVQSELVLDVSSETALLEYLKAGRSDIPEDVLIARESELENLAESAYTHFGARLTGVIINGAKNELLVFLHQSVRPSDFDWANADSRILLGTAPYSRTELDEQRTVLSNSLRANGVLNAVISINPDGSGMVVEVPNTSQLSLAESIAQTVTDIPVEVEKGEAVVTLDQRIDSVDKGGAGGLVVDGDGKSFCSTGFAVLKGLQGFLLSAAHCDVSGNLPWRNGLDGAALTLGEGFVTSIPAADSLLLNPVGGTKPQVFVGGISSSVTRKVTASAANFVGKTVCTSGANSGEHCGLLIVNDSLLTSCIPGKTFQCEMVKALDLSGGIAAASGDSGGPVYSKNDLGVTARGIISQGSAVQGYCQIQTNIYFYYKQKSICSDYVIYMPIRPLLDLWNVDLEVAH